MKSFEVWDTLRKYEVLPWGPIVVIVIILFVFGGG